jgi:hypothetical protein
LPLSAFNAADLDMSSMVAGMEYQGSRHLGGATLALWTSPLVEGLAVNSRVGFVVAFA